MITNKQIIEQATHLFKTYGIRTNTMDDIARGLGISKKTLYNWVRDKKEIIHAVIDQEYVRMNDALKQINEESGDSIEALIRINTLIINFLKNINPATISDLRKLYQSVYAASKNRFRTLFSDAILAHIRNGKSTHIFRNDVNEILITRMHTDRIDQMQDTSALWGSDSGSPEIIQEMITYYIRGLVSKQGEILLNKHLTDFNKYINE